jgi:hypothetical protein
MQPLKRLNEIKQNQIQQPNQMAEVTEQEKPVASTNPEQPLQKVHSWLSTNVDGFEVDYKTFEADMQDESNLKRLHENLAKRNGAFKVDYDTFAADMGLKKKGEPAAANPSEEDSSEDVGPVPAKPSINSILPGQTNGEEGSFTDQKLAPVEVVGEKPKDWVPTAAEMAEDKALGAYKDILPGQQPFQPGDVAPETNPLQTAWKTLKDTFANRIPANAAGFVAAMTPENATQVGPGGFMQLPKEQVEENKKAIEASSKALVKFAAGKMAESDKVALIRSYKQIDNPLDALNYVVQVGTQGATDIATTLATGGVSSFVSEIGNNYMDGVMDVAKEKGIDPVQVIEQGLDGKTSAIVFGTIQAGLDKIGAGEVVSAIGKEPIIKEIKRRGLAILKEAGTEVVQEVLGATSTAVTTGNPGKIIEDPSRYVDAFIGGGVGAGTFMAPEVAARGAAAFKSAVVPDPAQAGRRLMQADGPVDSDKVVSGIDKSIRAYESIIANPGENDTATDLKRYADNITKLEAYKKTVLPVPVNAETIIADVQEAIEAGGPEAAIQVAEQAAEALANPEPEPAKPAPTKKDPGNEEVAAIANGYAAKVGLPPIDPVPLKKLNVDHSKAIADAYEAMEHRPTDPDVVAAYRALKDETLAQHDDLVAAGYVMEPWEKEGQPYANSNEMMDDVRNNKHVYYFKTEEGFGSGQMDVNDNPMLEATPDGRPYNDIFRAVHDIMGHAKIGNQFGPLGEENAWRIHAQMYSPEARKAMTTETRGQNSWVNFGPHMRNADNSIKKQGDEGYLSVLDRPYAPQKVGLLPAATWDKDLIDPVAPAVEPAPVATPMAAEAPVVATTTPTPAIPVSVVKASSKKELSNYHPTQQIKFKDNVTVVATKENKSIIILAKMGHNVIKRLKGIKATDDFGPVSRNELETELGMSAVDAFNAVSKIVKENRKEGGNQIIEITSPTPATSSQVSPDEQIAAGKAKLAAILAGRNGKIYDVSGLGVDLVDALKDIAVGYIRKGATTAADFIRDFRTDNPELWDIEYDDL